MHAITRVVVAFLVAPLVGFCGLALGMCALLPFFGASPPIYSEPLGQCTLQMVPLITIFGGLLAYPVTLVVAVPLFVAFRRRRWLRWWQVGAGGVVVGVVGSLVLVTLDVPFQQWIGSFAPFSALVGLLAGIAFWFLAVYRNAS